MLARQAAAAEEPLRFAAGLYRIQARGADLLAAAHRDDALTAHLDDDAERLAGIGAAVLRYAQEEGPPALSEESRERRSDLPSTARTRLLVYWAGDRPSTEDYLSRAILRPYVEFLRSWNLAPDRVHKQGKCPFCGGAPWMAVRREGSLQEGARRTLACALCGLEWRINRIFCPACFEEDPYRLPSFQNDRHPAVRIEACETCHRYVKSLDLSLDARPIPEVDELLSIAMDLWAVEQGYTRIEPGLAGL